MDYNEQYWRNRGGEGPSPWANPPEHVNTSQEVSYGAPGVQEDETPFPPKGTGALKTQVGGDHYKFMDIQPVEYIFANNLGFIEGCIIKYITRYESKGGANDLDKIIHFTQLLKELRYGK